MSISCAGRKGSGFQGAEGYTGLHAVRDLVVAAAVTPSSCEFDADAKQFVKDGFVVPRRAAFPERPNTLLSRPTSGREPDRFRLSDHGQEAALSGRRCMKVSNGCDVGALSATPERQYDVIQRGITFFITYVIEKRCQLGYDDSNFGGSFRTRCSCART
jgi:hypothetical protein